MNAVIEAGWIITGSWPIDTEMETRIAAQGRRVLPPLYILFVVLARHATARPAPMRLAIGATFAGIASPHPRMDAASGGGRCCGRRCHLCLPRPGAGNLLTLFPCREGQRRNRRSREYLEHVWAAVAKEALAMVFKGADATGFEADARLTAMWLWTLKSPDTNGNTEDGDEEADSEDESERQRKPKPADSRLSTTRRARSPRGLARIWRVLTIWSR